MRIFPLVLCLAFALFAARFCSAGVFTTAPQGFESEEELEGWAKKQWGYRDGRMKRLEAGDARIVLVFTNRGSAYTLWHVDVFSRHKDSKRLKMQLSWDSNRHEIDFELKNDRLIFTSEKKEVLILPVSTLDTAGG